jgi:hypothetical protein
VPAGPASKFKVRLAWNIAISFSFTYLRWFLVESKQEILEQFIAVFDPVRILANDPNHGRLCLGLIKCVQILAQGADDALILVRISSENILDDHDCFLDDVGDLGLQQFEQHGDALVRGWLNFYC